jgi:hypothetical protein
VSIVCDDSQIRAENFELQAREKDLRVKLGAALDELELLAAGM